MYRLLKALPSWQPCRKRFQRPADGKLIVQGEPLFYRKEANETVNLTLHTGSAEPPLGKVIGDDVVFDSVLKCFFIECHDDRQGFITKPDDFLEFFRQFGVLFHKGIF